MTTLGAPVAAGGFWQLYLNWRYAVLFYSLLLTLAAGPLLGALGFFAGFLEFLLVTNLLAAVIPMARGWGRGLLLILLAFAVTVRLGADWLGHARLSAESLGLWTIVALLAAANALRFALRATAVDSEHVYAALSAYLLAGNFFGVFYWVLERAWPGSFSMATQSVDSGFSLPSAIYFSFVTLATLGYGDVIPRSDTARGLAILEAVAGQLYLAVMVARLVSLYVRGTDGGSTERL